MHGYGLYVDPAARSDYRSDPDILHRIHDPQQTLHHYLGSRHSKRLRKNRNLNLGILNNRELHRLRLCVLRTIFRHLSVVSDNRFTSL